MKLPFKIDLKDKVAVVTGGGGVLCSGFAKAIAQCGARVAILDLREENAKKVADEINADGGKALGISANVLEKDSQILAVFFLKQGEDPTYKKIYEGAWLNDRPYAVMHRVASSGKEKGAAKVCFDWVFEKYGNIRIDTHDDNHIMQHVLEKNGFSKCGRIYLESGDPRIAYQKSQAAQSVFEKRLFSEGKK